jgi:hypothetical protein
VVQGGVREGWSYGMLEERIGQKFGNSVLELVLSVADRRTDDDGVELSQEDRRADWRNRLALAPEDGLWVAAAIEVHTANTMLADLRRTAFPETVWARNTAGRERTLQWYASVAARLREIGFDAPIVGELEAVSHELVSAAA